jgi:hypothetical protein
MAGAVLGVAVLDVIVPMLPRAAGADDGTRFTLPSHGDRRLYGDGAELSVMASGLVGRKA